MVPYFEIRDYIKPEEEYIDSRKFDYYYKYQKDLSEEYLDKMYQRLYATKPLWYLIDGYDREKKHKLMLYRNKKYKNVRSRTKEQLKKNKYNKPISRKSKFDIIN